MEAIKSWRTLSKLLHAFTHSFIKPTFVMLEESRSEKSIELSVEIVLGKNRRISHGEEKTKACLGDQEGFLGKKS